MAELDVQVVTLEPLRLASVWGFGDSPEAEAWRQLEAWAEPRGLFANPEAHPIFGFNNPNPSADGAAYGYELWIGVDRATGPEADVRLVDFDGGLYAVTRCTVPVEGYDVIGETWQKLLAWRDANGYRRGGHQWLERSVRISQWQNLDDPGVAFEMDLYLPIAA